MFQFLHFSESKRKHYIKRFLSKDLTNFFVLLPTYISLSCC